MKTLRPPRFLLPLILRSQPEFSVVHLLPPLPESEVAVPFIVDDRFHSHDKVVGVSLAARGLWVSVGSWSADHGTDGVVKDHVVASLGGTPELKGELLRAGLWRRAGRAVEFHDWDFWNGPAAAPETLQELPGEPAAEAGPALAPARSRTPGARRVALHRAPGLKRKLRSRDGDQCRYCAKPVRWGKGRASDSAVWDWVEPEGPASPENVVTACKACGKAKAGRSLKESEMTLLPVPGPQKRYKPSNASDLGEHTCSASCNASGSGCNAYTEKLAGQKRYTPAKQDDHLDRSKSSSSGAGQQPVPVLDARARKARPGSQLFRLHVTAEFAAKNRIDITAAEADTISAEVLGTRQNVPCPLAYVLTAVRSERRPLVRWLPHRVPLESAQEPRKAKRLAAAKPDWCGKCYREDDRNFYDEQGRPKPCPACNPKFTALSEALAS